MLLGDLFLLSGSRTTLVTLLLLFVMGMGGSVWMIMLAAGGKEKGLYYSTTQRKAFTQQNRTEIKDINIRKTLPNCSVLFLNKIIEFIP